MAMILYEYQKRLHPKSIPQVSHFSSEVRNLASRGPAVIHLETRAGPAVNALDAELAGPHVLGSVAFLAPPTGWTNVGREKRPTFRRCLNMTKEDILQSIPPVAPIATELALSGEVERTGRVNHLNPTHGLELVTAVASRGITRVRHNLCLDVAPAGLVPGAL